MGTASEAVLSNTDLLHRILCGNVGATTFVVASRVSKGWREATTGKGASGEVVLAAASYTGGLVKGHFMGLLALTAEEAGEAEHEKRRRGAGGVYHLYSPAACEAAFEEGGGVGGWRERLSMRRVEEGRRKGWAWGRWNEGRGRARKGKAAWRREERLHSRLLAASA